MQYERSNIYYLEVIANVNYFSKKSNVVVPTERRSHKEYSCKIPNSSTHFGKGIKKVKDFEKYVDFQSQGYMVNNFGTHGKALLLEIYSC